MSVEPIGFLTIVLALVCLFLDYRVMATVLVAIAVLGSAAALFVGGANIQPAHLFIGVVALATLGRPEQCAAMLRALHPDRPGFWLMFFVAYGVVSAFFFPRVMAGQTEIISLGSSSYESTGFTVPLGPVSSNFTQSVYTISSFLVFVIMTGAAATFDGFRMVAIAAAAYVAANVFFGLLDLVTYLTGTQGILDFMRNARYTLHIETEVQGLKRIAGSFTEASSFARASLGALGFIGSLWICGWRPRLTGPLALATCLLAIMSTSSTALAGLPAVVVVLYLTAVSRCGISRRSVTAATVALALPLVTASVVLAVMAHPPTSAAVGNYLDVVIFSKGSTDSGIERGSWNIVAIQNFFDSGGLGMGLGTIRTSSIAAALIGGVGVVGTVLYLTFLGATFLPNPGRKGTFVTDVRTAARNGCIGLMVGDLLVGPTTDQGIFFFVLAAISAARPERAVVPIGLAKVADTGSRPAGAVA